MGESQAILDRDPAQVGSDESYGPGACCAGSPLWSGPWHWGAVSDE